MDNFYKNEHISDEVKANIAFQTTVAVRDTLSLSLTNTQKPSYEESLEVINDIDPALTELMMGYLGAKNDSDIIRQYKEEARLCSLKNGYEIRPETLIKSEIARLEDILKPLVGLRNQDTKLTKRKIAMLNTALKSLEPRKFTENLILQHDFSLSNRLPGLTEQEIGYHYRDYSINDTNSLRIRLLHPDHAEHVTGADLIYEHHNVELSKVRVVFMQYKMWENGKISVKDGGRNSIQINRLYNTICKKDFCEKIPTEDSGTHFRFPYCAAFYRPTDKYQIRKERMVSSGLHLPICEVMKKQLENKSPIIKTEIKHYCVNHYMFEQLFSLGLIGSDWMDYNELNNLYNISGILQTDDSIKIYASNIQLSGHISGSEFPNNNFNEDYPPF